jgi:hypothetical protein
VFTNVSTDACSLSGYPAAQLLRKGHDLAKSAGHGPGTVRTIVLKSQQSAQSTITVSTNCNAALSDQIRVAPPGIATPVVKNIVLRGCVLAVSPVARD